MTANAQYMFPALGETIVSQGSAVTLNINNTTNAAEVPEGIYATFSVSVDWSPGEENFSHSFDTALKITTAVGSVFIAPATTGSYASNVPTTMTWDGTFLSNYNPTVDGALDIELYQSRLNTSAVWSNVVVTIIPVLTCTAAAIPVGGVIDDCVAGTFTIDLEFGSVGDGENVSDGTNLYPIIEGIVTTGPFNVGDVITLVIQHSDPACNYTIEGFRSGCPLAQDICGTAPTVTDGEYTTTISSVSGGSEMATSATGSAFYAFTAPGDGTLYVNSCDGGADTYLNIGIGVCGTLAIEGSNDDSCASGLGNDYASEVTIDVIAGTVYYIEWDNRYNSDTFDWTLEFIPPPACTAAVVDSSTVTEDCNADGIGTFTVVVEVSDPGDLGSFFSDGTDTYPVSEGTNTLGTYSSGDTVTIELIAEDTACNKTVDTFSFTCPPVNDDCNGALLLECGVTIEATTHGATASGLDETCSGSSSTNQLDSFYTFEADGTSSYIVTLDGFTFGFYDPDALFVYSGSCEERTKVGCSFSPYNNPEEVFLDTPSAGKYTVRIFDAFGGANFTLDLTCIDQPAPPANDLCADATPIECGDSVTGSTANATGDFAPDVFYSIAGTANGEEVKVSLCGTSFDAYLTILNACDGSEVETIGDSCDGQPEQTFISDGSTTYIVWLKGYYVYSSGDYALAVTCVPPGCDSAVIASSTTEETCNPEDGTGTFTVIVEVSDAGSEGSFFTDGTTATYPVVAGTNTLGTYSSGDSVTIELIAEDTACSSTVGEFTFTCPEPLPVNDECDGALALECGVTIVGTNDGATASGLEASCAGYDFEDAQDSFYTFTANGTSSYTVSLYGLEGSTDFEGVLFVYSGSCDELTKVACSDTLMDPHEEVTLDTPVAGTYTVRVFNYENTGNFTLDLTCIIPPECTPAVIASSTTEETCNPEDGTGTFTVIVEVSDAGSEGSFFTDGTTATYPVVAGTNTLGTYSSGDSVTIELIAEDTACSSTVGEFTFTCPEPPPANDLCADATPIECGDSVTVSTANATGDSTPDVFYSIAGTANGEEVKVSLCGTSFDAYLTILNACDGSEVETIGDSCDGQPEQTFISDGSTTYIVWIEGYKASDFGDYALAVTCVPPGCDSVPSVVWTGSINSDWETAGNWENNLAPGLAIDADVTIPTAMPNYPVLTAGQELYISECSTVTVELNASLTVNSNAIVSNDGKVTNNGTTTFESDATGSAYIGSGMGMFMGDFTVERYIPAKRAYRQLGSPVTTSTPISENWQLDTHITGPAGNTDGFDVTQTGFSSMYIFDNTVYNYAQMANTNATNLLPGTMYHTLITGDRTTDLTNNTATPSVTTLRATGELTAENESSKTISVNVPEQRFIAAGNPFQSQVDMNAVLTTNATNISPNFYWVWDPTLGARGAYTAIVASSGTASAGDSDANQYLQAGQAGWVYTAGAGQSSVSFTQASKNTTGSETSVFRDASDLASQGQLRLSLYESSALANNETAADGVLILFDTEGNNAVDANDAPNITNLDENFATSNNGVLLSIENRAAPEDAEEIQLEINTYRNTNYTIVAEGISMQGATAFLYDNFTNISTEIPQSGTVNYSYSIDSGIPGLIASDRFIIVFAANALSVSTHAMEDIRLYPNPTNMDKFYLNVPLGMDDLDVTIYNILGAKLYHETGFTGGEVTINIGSKLSMGTYFVKLSSQGRTTTKKLTIN